MFNVDQETLDKYYLSKLDKLKNLINKQGVTYQEIRAVISSEINHINQKYKNFEKEKNGVTNSES